MNHRMRLIALGASALVFALLLASCGEYGDDDDSETGSTGVGGDTGIGGDTCCTGGSIGMGGDTGLGGGPATCTNVTACGGDVVRTWTVTGSCLAVSGQVDVSAFGLGCNNQPGVDFPLTQPTVTGSLEVAGTFTVNGDGTVADNTTTTGTVTFVFSGYCLEGATCASCARLATVIFPSLGYASATCEEDPNSVASPGCGNGCTCTATVDQSGGMGLVTSDASATSTYTPAGSDFTVNPGDLQYSYCVSGTALTVTPVSPTPTVTTGSIELELSR